MKSRINKPTLVIGFFLLGLLALDGMARLHQSATPGEGLIPHITAESAVAIFLIGLTVGMVGGIAAFFGYLVWKEKNVSAEARELDLLLEEIAMEQEAENLFPSSSDDSLVDETADSAEPWERDADWWRSEED